MIIDDDQGIVEVTSLVLEEKGYHVITLTQQDHIIESIEQATPDIIILDLWIFHHDGRQILSEVRQHPKLHTIPIILMSAHNELPSIASRIGANAFITKPFDINDLLDKVKQLLT